MRLPVIAITAMALTMTLVGQEKPPENKSGTREAVIIPVKTLSGDSFNRLAKLLEVFDVPYRSDEKLRTIVVYAPREVVTQMRRVVEELDRPGSEAAIGRNIELTLTLLLCSTKSPAESQPLPADLEPVARQLRAVTQYQDIRLWDIVPLHLQEGKQTDQSLRLPGNVLSVPVQPATGFIKIQPESVSRRDSGRYVRFSRISIDLQISYRAAPPSPAGSERITVSPLFQQLSLGLHTAGDFKEGQKTVLGKVSGIDDSTAVFAVISLKVLD